MSERRSLRGFLSRRPEPIPVRVLTASGRRVDLSAKATSRGRLRPAWQKDAWTYRDSVPEIRYAMAFLKYAVARVRLVPALAQPDGDEPTRLFDSKGQPIAGEVPVEVANAARDALLRLTCGTYQWAPLLTTLAELLEVPGEAWLVGYADPDTSTEVWGIRSIEELEQTDKG